MYIKECVLSMSNRLMRAPRKPGKLQMSVNGVWSATKSYFPDQDS